ncbi:hypothetical protein AURDEDRAFT_114495 [Auricularia subglabra TFB-10046 SS5]|nr:hypothetical protein AURDEDRAFT_114495 [Auricularia subglabra TFB-10046 SS5]
MEHVQFAPTQVTWIEHTYAPQPLGAEALLEGPSRGVQTHGNRDFISANFEHSQKLGKPSGACTRCKKLKMKCELRSGEAKCQRCKGGDYDCIPARRRPRRPRLHSTLTPGQAKRAAQNAGKNGANGGGGGNDEDSDDDNSDGDDEDEPKLPAKTSPMGMIARMANAPGQAEDCGSETTTAVDEGLDGASGVANPVYFQNKSPLQQQPPSHLQQQQWDNDASSTSLVPTLISPEEERSLFELYMAKINPCAALLDPKLHTYDSVRKKSAFLMTVVTAVASRHLTTRPDVYVPAMERAKRAAALSLVSAGKSVESCQAYILMALYGKPVKRWEEDRCWLYSGLAIRMATDLNLHRVQQTQGKRTERAERETLNRTRVWLVCFNLDRSFSTQFGRPPTILNDFPNVREWWRSAGDNGSWNDPYDANSCAFAEVMIVMTAFQQRVFSDGVLDKTDLEGVTREYDAKLKDIAAYWQPLLNNHMQDYPGCEYRARLWPFCTSYSRLVMFSFGFQEAFSRGAITSADDMWFTECVAAASEIITVMVEHLAHGTYYKYAFHSHYVYVTFAAAFLLKLLRPSFEKILRPGQRDEIVRLIRSIIDAFSHPDVAADEAHASKHYARFLKNVLARYVPPAPSSGAGKASSKSPTATTSSSKRPRRAVAAPKPAAPAAPAAPVVEQPVAGGNRMEGGLVSFFQDAQRESPLRDSPPLWTVHVQPHAMVPSQMHLTPSPSTMAMEWQYPAPQQQQQQQQWNPNNNFAQPQQQQQPEFTMMSELTNDDWWQQFHMPGWFGNMQAQHLQQQQHQQMDHHPHSHQMQGPLDFAMQQDPFGGGGGGGGLQ